MESFEPANAKAGGKLRGPSLRLEAISVAGRLAPFSGQFQRGEFVAIVGRSGSGKSTLIQQVVEAKPGITFNAVPAAEHLDAFQQKLGYVSQHHVIHQDLRIRDLLRLSISFRNRSKSQSARQLESSIDSMLDQIDLPDDRRDAYIRELSGGEQQRVQVAVELINDPELIVLDEPTSGLDPERAAKIMKLLRNASERGATVLVVTHDRQNLPRFDRILEFAEGVCVFDGPPQEYLGRTKPNRGDHESSSTDNQSEEPSRLPSQPVTLAHSTDNVDHRHGNSDSQASQPRVSWPQLFPAYFRREWLLIKGDWLRHVLLAMIAVPLFFAVAIGMSVPDQALTLLGFLSILATIWMGASLSLMSVVGERVIVEHERKLFLKPKAYLAAKTVWLLLRSLTQTTVFFGSLMYLIQVTEKTGFWHWPFVLLTLWLTGWASVCLGLLISVACGYHRVAANFVMPLIMIAQIVFSVQIADRSPNDDLYRVYGRFNFRTCQMHPSCNRWAEVWSPESEPGNYGCYYCFQNVTLGKPFDGSFRATDSETYRNGLPSRLAAAASYATISRYADITLRSFAYDETPASKTMSPSLESERTYAHWRLYAISLLSAMSILLYLASSYFLRQQPAY